ncbi:unnamed protein product [Cuscuta campestris]|uniref:Uncharacterized protein n=1 Tax=Cuscuta campestris TaxID=132261 RepID=A0A484LMY4_9ASTE|nr:unnamed protein product [Cuscuta campestris]
MEKQRRPCAACFRDLLSCYSPVHQMKQYYRVGVLDNCYDKWSALSDCLRSKKVEGNIKKPHIWTFRTPEEAGSHWNLLFGHIVNKKKK